MVSAFASQLQAIAANSTNELNLKARRTAHAESLLFERQVAVKQDFELLYNLCHAGFQELCQLDARFRDFERNLFSEQSKNQDRDQMSRSENEALDAVLRRCLMLLGSRLLLSPAVKALEWLVRRFQVHVHNVDDLLMTLLPYHQVNIWATVLSIVPGNKVTGIWKFLRPYLKTTWNIPRHAIAYAASTDDAFFARFNAFQLGACQDGLEHPTAMKFWSSVVVEALSHRLRETRSGRKEIQSQRTQDLLHKILPLLSEAFDVPGCMDLTTTCYTITVLLAAKADLADNILDSLLLAVAQSFEKPDHDAVAALVTMVVTLNHKSDATIPRKVLEILAALEGLPSTFKLVSEHHSCGDFLLAVVESSVSNLKKKNRKELLLLVTTATDLLQQLNFHSHTLLALKSIVAKTASLDAQNPKEADSRQNLIKLLQDLNEKPSLGQAFTDLVTANEQDSATLETILGTTIILPTLPAPAEKLDVAMTDVDNESTLPVRGPPVLSSTWQHGSSFLASLDSDVFQLLVQQFEASIASAAQLDTFRNQQIWQSVTDTDLLWQTFLIRLACSNAASQARVKAVRLFDEAIVQNPAVDMQCVVLHAIILLSAGSRTIRHAASNLIVHARSALETSPGSLSTHDLTALYGIHTATKSSALSQQQAKDIVTDLLLSSLDECVLDQTYIIKLVQDALHPQSRHEAKKSHLQALFSLLIEHALASPLLVVKLAIIRMLEGTERVGSKLKSKALSRVLHQWLALSDTAALELVSDSGYSLDVVDGAFISLLDLQDSRTLSSMLENSSSGNADVRAGCVNAIFDRIRNNYSRCDSGAQQELADMLFDLASDQSSTSISANAREVLGQIDLSTDNLASVLQSAQADTSGLRAPSAKRRRRSSSSNALPRAEASKAIDNAASRITMALELVDSNDPEEKPELLNAMFEMLATLRLLQAGQIESPYLLNLCLSSITSMLSAVRTRREDFNLSGVKPELVTDCLRNSDNAEVQNTSLAVLAALSVVAPDKMVHNVMPIFTFIGRNMLSKDDEHSVNVINEAIDKIIPALLSNLKKGKNPQSYQASLASMLASFTAAYDHIPNHRRVAFYQKLIQCIDARESGYMLLALLADQRAGRADLQKPLQDIIGLLPASTQLLIYQQLIHIAVDVFASTPKQAALVFNITRSTTSAEKLKYSQAVFTAALHTLSTPNLASSIARASRNESDEASRIKVDLQKTFEATLAAIGSTKKAPGDIHVLSKQTMDLFLTLPSTRDLFEIVTPRLDSMDHELQPQALRILAQQVGVKSSKMSQIHAAAMVLLRKLASYVRDSSSTVMQLATLSCVDRLFEVYGRKDPESVVVVSQVIIDCMGTKTTNSQILAAELLTLTSAFEAIKEAAVPLVPVALGKVAAICSALGKDEVSAPPWSAVLTLLASIFSHAAFMVTEADLTQILPLILSTNIITQAPADFEVLARTIGKHADLDVLVQASKNTVAHMAGPATAPILSLLSRSIESSAKSTVVKHADLISSFFVQILDFLSQDGQSDAVMAELKAVSIKYVYKLNDTTFRPIFESWIEWALEDEARQTVLFDLLAHFFDTLKAIVTSYTTYLLKPMATILAQPDDRLKPTLTLLATITTHDQDGFFASPSHFDTVSAPLVALLELAAQKSTRPIVPDVISTLISLATSTVDSPNTHAAIASQLVKFKNHTSAHVRLASIQSFVQMTEDEDLGDEFVSNVVGIGAGEGEGARGGGSVGEIMVYVNEMLEDDDEDVELQVRRWVQLVRAKVGEDMFEV